MPQVVRDIGEMLYTERVKKSARIRALVEDRVRPNMLDQKDKMPAIRWELMSEVSYQDLSGPSGAAESRLQYDCYGETRQEANEVAKALIDVLDGFSGRLTDTIGTTIAVDSCLRDGKFDRIDPPLEGQRAPRYRRTVDFVVCHSEPVPTLALT